MTSRQRERVRCTVQSSTVLIELMVNQQKRRKRFAYLYVYVSYMCGKMKYWSWTADVNFLQTFLQSLHFHLGESKKRQRGCGEGKTKRSESGVDLNAGMHITRIYKVVLAVLYYCCFVRSFFLIQMFVITVDLFIVVS